MHTLKIYHSTHDMREYEYVGQFELIDGNGYMNADLDILDDFLAHHLKYGWTVGGRICGYSMTRPGLRHLLSDDIVVLNGATYHYSDLAFQEMSE